MESDFIKPSTRPDIDALKELGKDYETLYIVAVCLVMDTDGKVLIIQRNSKTGYDTWAFPGGKVDNKDKSLKLTSERELYEEVGLTLSEPIQIPDILHVGLNNTHGLNAMFIFRIDNEQKTRIVVNKDEVKDYRWVNPGEFPGNFFLPHSPIKENWRRIVSPNIM